MAKTYDIRDPIHGQLEFNEFERSVMDHPYVQRLRHIKQLGFVNLVFPGGSHDRFSHSLGVMHVAGRLFDQLTVKNKRFAELYTVEQINYLKRCVRLAGLLHDVGHPPCSHSSEGHLPDLELLNLPTHWFGGKTEKRKSRHEDFTLWLVQALGEENVDVTPEMSQDIASLIHHKVVPADEGKNFKQKDGWNCHSILRAMISGECDADRMDYLLRDSYTCGVAYGQYDLDRLIFSLHPFFNEEEKEIYFCLGTNGIFSFEDFLLARYHMFLQVYLHKTVMCFDYFLNQAFAQKEIEFPSLNKPEQYMELTDDDVFIWLRDAARAKKEWSSRLYHRRPAKRLIYLSALDAQEKNIDEVYGKITKKLSEEGVLHFGITTGPYLTNIGSKGAPPFFVHRPTVQGKDRYVPMEHYSRLIDRYNERIDAVHVFVLHEELTQARDIVAKLL